VKDNVASFGCRLHSFQIAAKPRWARRPIGEACPLKPQSSQEASSTYTMCQRRTGECLCVDDADPKLMVPKVDTTFLSNDN
jgi:hypothetical protein